MNDLHDALRHFETISDHDAPLLLNQSEQIFKVLEEVKYVAHLRVALLLLGLPPFEVMKQRLTSTCDIAGRRKNAAMLAEAIKMAITNLD